MTTAKRMSTRTRSLVAAVLSALVAASLSSRLSAQDDQTGAASPLRGQVVLGGAPVGGVHVSLHRITSEASGAVAVAMTDPAGRFEFSREVDEATAFQFYFVTAEHNSVTFFGPFVRPDEDPTEYLVAVYDTAAVPPEPLRVAARHIVLMPEAGGSWEVNEIIAISNPTSVAIVPDGDAAAFELHLPEGVTDFEVGPGDVLPHEIAFMGGRLLHLTPVIPGSRDIFIRYRLPQNASPTSLAILEPTDTLNIYVRQPSHLTGISGIQSQRMIDVDGQRYLQYSSADLVTGTTIELRWSRPGPPVDPVMAAVTLSLILLGLAAVVAARNRSGGPSSA